MLETKISEIKGLLIQYSDLEKKYKDTSEIIKKIISTIESLKEQLINEIESLSEKQQKFIYDELYFIKEQINKLIRNKHFRQELIEEINHLLKILEYNSQYKKITFSVHKKYLNFLLFIRSNFLYYIILTLIFITIFWFTLYKKNYTVYRYAKVGISKSFNINKFSPYLDLYIKETEIIKTYFSNNDTVWIKNNLFLTPQEVKSIKNFYIQKDIQNRLLKVEIKGKDYKTINKLLNNLSIYFNSKSFLTKYYEEQRKHLKTFINFSKQNIEFAKKQLTNENYKPKTNFALQDYSNIFININKIYTTITYAQNIYDKPNFYYVTSPTSLIIISTPIKFTFTSFISLILSTLMFFVLFYIQKRKAIK